VGGPCELRRVCEGGALAAQRPAEYRIIDAGPGRSSHQVQGAHRARTVEEISPGGPTMPIDETLDGVVRRA
jgi:hypothetical protein